MMMYAASGVAQAMNSGNEATRVDEVADISDTTHKLSFISSSKSSFLLP